ncbi:uncharacterized protein LOC100892037 [Strongylocentrotus purpuratus]|uniref:F-box domain-containing protein n=1 Tax=Strongylocentrotus purpuratus TaxID=7668 RepID=A0A7M7HP96_STRPU|nr:uncharacterized protein LOC100892037 [Strongylocentrotus purpuratus]
MADVLLRSKRVRRPKLSPDFVYQSPMAPTKKSKLVINEGAMNSPTSHTQEEGRGFHELSAEMILQVLKYLPIKGLVAASGVCKKWRKLCKGASLWKCVSFEGSEVDRLRPHFWKRLGKLGTTCLDLHDCVNPETSNRKAINYIIQLTNVKALYFGVIEKGDLTTIVVKMPQLKILHVACLLPPLSRNSNRILLREDGAILYDIGRIRILKDLEELKLSSIYGVCVPSIAFYGGTQALGDLKKLKKLILTNFDGLSSAYMCFLKDLPYLQHLELGNCSDFELHELASLRKVENLKSLSLTKAHCMCPGVPCTCIGTYLRGLKRLRKLSLIMCRIPDDLAESIQELPELKSLEVWPCLDKFLTSQEQVVDCFMSIFRGLEHLHSITIGILDNSCIPSPLCSPYNQIVNDRLADRTKDTCCSRFSCNDGWTEEGGTLDESLDQYEQPLISGDEVSETGEEMMNSEEEECSGAISNKPQDSQQEKDRTTVSRERKGQRRGIKRRKKKDPKMGTYDMIKYGLIDLLPSTRLTFYLVKMSRSRGEETEMFYISRKEEHFNMAVLSQI